jgi:pyrroline-5-carboxylate reductase
MTADLAMLSIKIGLVGAGRMATALGRGFVNAKLLPASAIFASDPHEAARAAFEREVPGAKVVAENGPVVTAADVIFLAVKPQQIQSVLAEIRGAMSAESLVVSIAAGVTLKGLAAGLAKGQRIIRVMPNTPCLIGKGVSAYSLGDTATKDDGRLVAELLSAVGVAHEVPESQLDAVTGLSGSGPAFGYTMIEQLTAGGVEMGLPAALAADLAARTVLGAAEMVLDTGDTPAVLRDRVTSPGGTTLAGLTAMANHGFQKSVVEAVRAATLRSAELGKQSS